jgi:hypothetical protein
LTVRFARAERRERHKRVNVTRALALPTSVGDVAVDADGARQVMDRLGPVASRRVQTPAPVGCEVAN